MRLSALFLFAVCLQVSAATYSQTVSYTGKNVGLKSVFASVKQQTGFGVFYENGETMLQSTAPVTLDLKNVSLDMFLRVCLKDQPLDYSVEGTTIFIKHKESSSSSSSSSSAPIPEIKGRVTNTKGEPLVNANITVKRTGHGTITDANGNFTLRNITTDDIISISFIGYKAQSVPLRDRTSLTLVLEAATNELDKVVVQAYGTTSQRLATGNIGVVRAEDIAKQPVMNVLQAIQGQVAGALVTQTSGYASAPIKIEIRGRSTINPNFPSDPLYIIDGVPLTILDVSSTSSYAGGSSGVLTSGNSGPAFGQSPFFNINPNDIESIEILKDADATAIYGSRGANGVILITTKKGTVDKTHFNINVYQGISKITKHYNLLNTHQYLEMRREALKNDGTDIDINSAPDLVAMDTTKNTDWQKYLWGGIGKTTDAEASISGGDLFTSFRIASGYHNQQDISTISGTNQRGSLSLNINHKTRNERFSILLTANYSSSFVNTISLPYAVLVPPNSPSPFDPEGNLNYKEWSVIKNIIPYPFSTLKQPYTSNTNLINSSAVLNYNICKWMLIRTIFGYNNGTNKQTNYQPISSQDPDSYPTGSSTFGYGMFHNLLIEPQVEFNSFISKGKITILIGGTSQTNVTEGISLLGLGYMNDLLLKSINNAPTKYTTNYIGEYRYSAGFGRLNYNWRNKYILNLNARRDGSSRFGPGKEFGNFSSIGGAWIFTEEPFIKDKIPFMSFGKLRTSYGTTGNDQIGDYKYFSQWATGRYPYNNVQSILPQGHTDSLLHWETNRKLEIAMAMGFIKDKYLIEVSWYRNRCNDQLIKFPTPILTGFSYVTANSPANVENMGWEFQFSAKLFDNSNFKWQTKMNIGINKNKLLSYPNLSQSPYAGYFTVGQSLNIKKLLHYTGVDPQTGLYTFKDKNKDNQITTDFSGKIIDDTSPYDLSPKYEGGITTTINVNRLEISFLIYFRKQRGVNALSIQQTPGGLSNQPIEVLNRWQKPGDVTNIAKFTTVPYDQTFTNFNLSDAIFTDASFIRFQNFSLSYSIPEKIISRAKISSVRFFVQAQNLFLITKYKGVDPEVQNFGGLPVSRIITSGLSIIL